MDEYEREYEYGFIADGGEVRTKAFGLVPFESAKMAYHTGSKWFWESLEIVRREPGGTWEPVDKSEWR